MYTYMYMCIISRSLDQDQYYIEGQGPVFRIGSIRSDSVDHDHDPNNPNSFAWCLMNLCISKVLQSAIRKVLSTAGLEILGEFGSVVTAALHAGVYMSVYSCSG